MVSVIVLEINQYNHTMGAKRKSTIAQGIL
jgi:hypothetical protein